MNEGGDGLVACMRGMQENKQGVSSGGQEIGYDASMVHKCGQAISAASSLVPDSTGAEQFVVTLQGKESIQYSTQALASQRGYQCTGEL